MVKKLLIDCDPGIDDALAVTLALFAPEVEVLAITATEGNVSAPQASRNVLTIVEQLDPPRSPRTGVARGGSAPPNSDSRLIHGDDGLGNNEFVVAGLHQEHPSDKILTDLIREEQDNLTVLALGPLSNIARVLAAEPELAARVGRVVMMGGSVQAGGNVTPAAEFNIYGDPPAAAAVFRSPMTKILVPLDVSHQLTEGLDFLDALPDVETRAGRFLARIVPFLFRAVRQHLGFELIHLHECVALMAAIFPEDFEMVELAGAVETEGTLCRGATIFDRRSRPEWRVNMEVAMKIDVHSVRSRIRELLRVAGERS